ncbi:hypothetical protein DMUE_6111 [Dictyocoela muelleri]|nr:hypothetical protein DMUE_6111 [Dictyocoela muelleri]
MLKRLNRTIDHEFFNYISDNNNIIELLQVLEIIPEHKSCPKCSNDLKIKDNIKYNIGKAWRCSRCRNYFNLLDDSSLCGKKISSFVFLKFAYYFFNKNNFTANYIMHNCDIGEEKYASILSIVREKISKFVRNNKRQLGGILKEVQIDETYWAKRKYGIGDIVKPIWIWGPLSIKLVTVIVR